MYSALENVLAFVSFVYFRTIGRVNYTDTDNKPKSVSESANAIEKHHTLSAVDRATLDNFQIASLLRHERYCRDTRQWQKVRNCYHANASNTRIAVGAFKGNIDGFMSLSQMITPPSLRVLHHIEPVEIQVKGSRAVAISLENTMNRFDHKGAEYELTSWNRSIFRLERIEETGWRILHWETIYNRDQLAPVSTGTPMPDMSSVMGTESRASYRCLAWLTMSRGVKMSSDLPGDDRPNTVAEVIKNYETWLNE